jgi:hypothetical protein
MNQSYQKTHSYSSSGCGAPFLARHPDRAFVACNESASNARQRLIEHAVPLTGLLILSALDNPSLNSLDAIASALPASIKVLEIHNIECLLPGEKRNSVELLRLIDQIARFMLNRGMTGGATSTIDVGNALTHGGWL